MMRSVEPISTAMMPASEVLPRPGGPASSTCSHGSPRALGGLEEDRELLLQLRPGRRTRRGCAGAACGRTPPRRGPAARRAGGGPASALTPAPASGRGAAHALLDAAGRRRRTQGVLGLGDRHAQADERVAGGRVVVAGGAPARLAGRRQPMADLVLEVDHEPLGGLAADAGDAREERVVADRTARRIWSGA